MYILLALLGLVILPLMVMVIIGAVLSGPRYRGPVTDHFDGSKFLNPGKVKAEGGLAVLKWMFTRKPGPWAETKTENFGKHPLAHFKGGIRITFINHSSFLIQVDGVNILTDPVWSKRVSPFTWSGPKRMRPPGLRFGDLPRIHVVLLTHNHYDHLDVQTMRMVWVSHHPQIIVPLGVKRFLDKNHIGAAFEMDWWQEIQLENKLTINCVPAQHFSGRGLLDRDATLWCGYVITTTAGRIYFAGDTGYNENTFKEIARRFAPFKLSMIPIGAYKPKWFMSPIHVSPEEAVKIHLDVKSETSIGMHFGTFPLADDGGDDPKNDLNEALYNYKIAREEFLILQEGEARVFE